MRNTLLKTQVAQNQVAPVLAQLLAWAQQQPDSHAFNLLTQLSRRWHANESQSQQHTLSQEDYRLEKNRIAEGLMKFLDEWELPDLPSATGEEASSHSAALLNELYQRQQKPEMRRLLAAQKQLYSEGKRIHVSILISTFVCAMLFPLLGHVFPAWNNSLMVITAFILIGIELGLARIPKQKAAAASRIQEEFDTRLYELPWEEALAGRKVDILDIAKAADALPAHKRGNIDDEPWYGDYSHLPLNRAILHCQKENLYWDQSQKQQYLRLLVLLLISSLGFALALGHWAWRLDWIDIGIQVLVPLSPLAIFLSKSIQNILRAARSLQISRDNANDLLAAPGLPSVQALRKLQNHIYRIRRDSDLIPDKFYEYFRNSYSRLIQYQTRTQS